MVFKLLSHNEINKELWEKKMLDAFNGNLYGYAWYLDLVSPNWQAIVSTNYEILVPLPVVKFFGKNIIQQPFFCQQLGVYCHLPSQLSYTEQILTTIQDYFPYCYLQLNKYNQLKTSNLVNIVNRVNYELDLISPYSYLSSNYSENTRRNVQKSLKNRLLLKINELNHQTFINFLRKNVGYKLPELQEKHYHTILAILKISDKYKFSERYAVYNEKQDLLAAAYFIFSHGKAYYLFGATNDEGKKQSAMFLLFDSFIRRYAQKHLTLDFEGSTIPGLARFYEGFGAISTTYAVLQYNRLPFYLRWIKK